MNAFRPPPVEYPTETETDRLQTDVAAFEALYQSHGARMKSVALNLLGNRSDAEDAVQEALLRAYRNRQAFRSDAALWTWVYRILLNACHDVGRRRVARRDAQSVPAEEALELRAPAGDHSLSLTLRRALAELAPIHREVFLLCEVEGYTHREVAMMLEIPEGTSKGRLFEARRQLRAMLRSIREPTEVDS